MFKILDGKTSFHQWDINQKLIVFNPEVVEVHFTNATLGKALVVEVYTEGEQRLAEVPNIILQDAFDIKVYGFCGECVRDKKTFNVIARAKPEDYIYTEVELKNFESLEETVFNAIGEQNAQLEEYVDTVKDNEKRIEVIEKELEPITFNPVFKDNSWEQIATAARMGVAQNYWNVGDYKEITIPIFKLIENCYTIEAFPTPLSNLDWKKFIEKMKEFGCMSFYEYYGYLQFGTRGEKPDGQPFVRRFREGIIGAEWYWFDSWESAGITLSSSYSGKTFNIYFDYKEYMYPVTIIGFNHDKIANKAEYGRDRAGITLQLGASRAVYGDKKASVFDVAISGIMTADGKHYKSPNKVLADYTEGATNWADGGFRVALQNILDDSDVADYVVAVQKYTSQYYNSTNQYASPMLTHDKVFLPSEYEVFGLVAKSPAPEGKQYEFYEDGYSKFMWSEELLNGAISGARLWLRSAASEKVNRDEPNSIYGTSIYLGVNALNPLNISYMPSAVASGDSVAAYIAPCFCM